MCDTEDHVTVFGYFRQPQVGIGQVDRGGVGDRGKLEEHENQVEWRNRRKIKLRVPNELQRAQRNRGDRDSGSGTKDITLKCGVVFDPKNRRQSRQG